MMLEPTASCPLQHCTQYAWRMDAVITNYPHAPCSIASYLESGKIGSTVNSITETFNGSWLSSHSLLPRTKSVVMMY